MNFDILEKSIPEECINTFLINNKRYDGRKFNESRKFSFTVNVISTEKYSAIGSLGLNKIIIVLKENKNLNKKDHSLDIVVDHFEKNGKTDKIKDFIEKLTKDNIIYKNEQNFCLYITIESEDGNIYELIGNSFLKFFESYNDLPFALKTKFICKTFCFINSYCLEDPINQEISQSDFALNVIKFEDGKYHFFKIKGNTTSFNTLLNKIENL